MPLAGILSAFGLSGAAGLNAYIPLLLVAVLGRLGVVELGEPWSILTHTWAIVLISVLLVVELVVDKVPGAAHINDMLHAEKKFLAQFRTVDLVTAVPMFLPGWKLTQPGCNDGGEGHRIYYVGGQPQVSDSMEATTKFLDVMDWESNADRTNAVAAVLTVVLRNFWPGGKPVLIVTANQSHAGKGDTQQHACHQDTHNERAQA